MEKISAYILAFNEAEKIADAVSSVLWADEIVVADSGSTDRTAEIAESLGARDLLAALRRAHSPAKLKNLWPRRARVIGGRSWMC